MQLTIRTLGRFAVQIDDTPVAFATRKAAALLALLAHAGGRPVSRERLAAMLWPRGDALQARASLRQAVAQLRRALGPLAGRVGTAADTLWLGRDRVTVDVDAVQAALAADDPNLGALYGGPFLDDLALPEEPFEDWRRAEAARLDERVQAALVRMLLQAVADGDGDRAAELGECLLAMDPALEAAHAALIRLHLGRGALGSAMRQYERCRAALARVYGVAPSAETEALRRRIAAPPARREEPGGPPPGPPVVAVLPFTDLSDGPDAPYRAAGIAEDITAELSRFRSLRVIARHSAFAVAGPGVDAADAGRRLGARYILTGSVRGGGALRVVTELIDVATGHYLWSHRYDFGADGVGAALADIAGSVVGALAARIDTAVLEEGRRRPIDDLGTYDLWLRALARLRVGSGDAHLEARGLLERALAADPDCARAHAGLSLTYFNEWSCLAWDRWEENATQAQRHAEAAVARDPTDHVTHAVLGRILLYRRDFVRAERHAERAMALNPNDADTLVQNALSFAYLGDPARGIAAAEAAIRLNPFHDDWYFVFAAAPYLIARDMGRLVDLAQRAPDVAIDIRAFIAVGLALLGREDAAARQMSRFLDHFRRFVTTGREPAPGEPARWIMHVNPLRRPEDRAFLRQGLAQAGLPVPPDAGEEPAPG
ncbi:hypothetical protein STVA_05580 [Allostella vacuolata]|nr:hypothetical protein STVA_05580 [Stella vacuolata]